MKLFPRSRPNGLGKMWIWLDFLGKKKLLDDREDALPKVPKINVGDVALCEPNTVTTFVFLLKRLAELGL
jgi:hypothetical protein